MVFHRCDISSKEAVLPGRNDAEMGPANLYSQYNETYERFCNIIEITNEKISKR